MHRATDGIALLALIAATPVQARGPETTVPSAAERTALEEAQRQLRQTFTNLQFEAFGLAPVNGPLYQAFAGGRILYYAPQSQHLLFAAVYDRDGTNLTALAESAAAAKKIAGLDLSQAFMLGPADAPTVIEFTDPDCPYCRALERWWAVKAAEGRHVRRVIFFVGGIHAQASAKAEHILCSADPEAAFRSIYAGAAPRKLLTCKAGADRVATQQRLVTSIGLSGTPTLIFDGRVISGFRQDELEALLSHPEGVAPVQAPPPNADGPGR